MKQATASQLVEGAIRISKLVKLLLSQWLKQNPSIETVLSFLESEPGMALLVSAIERPTSEASAALENAIAQGTVTLQSC